MLQEINYSVLFTRYVFFMDVKSPFTSLCLCVNKCPENELASIHDVQLFSQTTGSELCRYDIKPNQYSKQDQSKKGPCPLTPVLGR